TLTITLSGAGATGILSGSGLTSTGEGVYTLTGTAASITTELKALVFTPAAEPPGSTTTTFTLSDLSSDYATATVNNTTTVIDSVAAAAPTITGTVAGQPTTGETPLDPFATAIIGDPNSGATDTLTITLSGAGATGILSGSGLTSTGEGVYTLTGTAASITTELKALVFTPAAEPPGSTTTTFTLSDLSSDYATATVNNTTTVIDSVAAAAPTITGTVAGQPTPGETPLDPFATAIIGDPNSGATDTLTITLSGAGATGILSGSGLTSTGEGVYTLTGTAASITTELKALVFTPAAEPPGSTTTTFTLSDLSSDYATATVNNTTTVIDSVAAAAPTITGTVAGQPTPGETPLDPFATAIIGDPNSGATDTLTITLSGAGATGILSGS